MPTLSSTMPLALRLWMTALGCFNGCEPLLVQTPSWNRSGPIALGNLKVDTASLLQDSDHLLRAWGRALGRWN